MSLMRKFKRQRERKMPNGNGDKKQPPKPGDPAPQFLPPGVAQQITINLYPNGQVNGTGPTDMKVMMYMLGKFIESIGQLVEFKPPSPIIKPPPGTILK